MTYIKQLLCRHDYSGLPKTDFGSWFPFEFVVPQTGDKIICERQIIYFTNTCSKCGKVKCSEGYNQRPAPGDVYENAKPNRDTTNDDSYGKFED